MSRSGIHRFLGYALGLCLLATPGHAAELVFDSWVEPLRPNPCLTTTHAPVIYLGLYCETTCPPGIRKSDCGGGGQAALSTVLLSRSFPGRPLPLTVLRLSQISQASPVTGAAADAKWISSTAGVSVRTTDPLGTTVNTQWMSPNQAIPLALDLQGMGAVAAVVHVDGDITPSKPLSVELFLQDNSKEFCYGGTGVTVTAPGDVTIPLSSLFISNGFSLQRVDLVQLQLNDCPGGYCTGPGSRARQYSFGALRFALAQPTDAVHHSWSQVKQIYR